MFDAETGLNQNWNQDYDAKIGTRIGIAQQAAQAPMRPALARTDFFIIFLDKLSSDRLTLGLQVT